MHHLVYNNNTGTLINHLYKKTGHLVRTPITVTLNPDQRAVYQVAGQYRAEGSVWWADAGFIGPNTASDVNQMGYNCMNAFVNHTDWRMDWAQVTTTHNPEMVWYQGAYATSAPSLNASLQSSEAYCQMAAYHFTLPQSLRNAIRDISDLDITAAQLEFTNGGVIVCYQGAYTRSSNNFLWKNQTSGDRSWTCLFGVMNQLGHYQTVAAAPYGSYDIASSDGTPRSARDLWGRQSTSQDGGIPILNSPVTCQFGFGSNVIQTMNNSSNINNGFWVVSYFQPLIGSTSNYRPRYVGGAWQWACASVWGLKLKVSVG